MYLHDLLGIPLEEMTKEDERAAKKSILRRGRRRGKGIISPRSQYSGPRGRLAGTSSIDDKELYSRYGDTPYTHRFGKKMYFDGEHGKLAALGSGGRKQSYDDKWYVGSQKRKHSALLKAMTLSRTEPEDFIAKEANKRRMARYLPKKG